ncbi:hypothetical protein CT113_10465 [Levilactobacillus brevis]|uniref:hypothetical protein n=1 Tax=Levilactobacillus brevis TaxID=1580 RepID=UPI000419733E|nr:hypothetical protein [Levilactobacillus brevis]ATU70722.1 hypothetical protein CT113_10465 [Levilactobacillus brevis]
MRTTSKVTKRYLKLGAIIAMGLFVMSLLLHVVFGMELGSVSDLVGGLGAIFAILGIGWQTTIQTELEDNRTREARRPYSLFMRYMADTLDADEVVMYSSQRAFEVLGKNADQKIEGVLHRYLQRELGGIRLSLLGSTPVYNVVISLNLEHGKESLQVPMLRPDVEYFWLPGTALKKVNDLNEQTGDRQVGKSDLFPEDLKESVSATLRFTTSARETAFMSFDRKKNYQLIGSKIVYQELKPQYQDSTGHSTKMFCVGK